MTQQKVYVVRTFGENDAEPFNELLGIFANLSDAKTVMAQDIEQIKKIGIKLTSTTPTIG